MISNSTYDGEPPDFFGLNNFTQCGDKYRISSLAPFELLVLLSLLQYFPKQSCLCMCNSSVRMCTDKTKRLFHLDPVASPLGAA